MVSNINVPSDQLYFVLNHLGVKVKGEGMISAKKYA